LTKGIVEKEIPGNFDVSIYHTQVNSDDDRLVMATCLHLQSLYGSNTGYTPP